MKVSYITLHYISNYGSVLQTYATQEVFNKIGVEAECVDYVRDNCSSSLKRALNCYEENFSNNSFAKKAIYCLYYMLGDVKRNSVFSRFIQQHIKLSAKYGTYDELVANPPQADIYCTGSDQTWNSVYNGGIEPAYYLQYAPKNKRKIALAASFGTEMICDGEFDKIKSFIHEYDHISVRELSAKKILDDMDYPSAKLILDPTLLISRDEWKKLFEKTKYANRKYLLVFALNKNPAIDRAAEKLSEQFGLPIVRVSFSMKDVMKKNIEYIPSVGKLLSMIDRAEYVLTDSFHGTAFSLNFEKQVFVVYPEQHSTRLKSILEITENLHRVISAENFNVADIAPIQYKNTSKIINENRKSGFDFVKVACVCREQ